MFCWSANTIFVKLAMDDGLGVFTVNLLRMPVIAVLLIATLIVRRQRVHTPMLPLRSLLVLIVAAVINATQDLLYFYSLQTSDLSTVVPLAATSPVFALLLAALFLKERLRLSTSLGTVLTVAGIIMVT
jgi:transporter family protein